MYPWLSCWASEIDNSDSCDRIARKGSGEKISVRQMLYHPLGELLLDRFCTGWYHYVIHGSFPIIADYWEWLNIALCP